MHFCELLAEQGAQVLAAARREDRLRALAQRMVGQGAEGTIHPLFLDVTDDAAVRDCLLRHPIDVLVNNAGISKTGNAVVSAMEDIDAVLQVDLRAVIVVARAAIAQWREAGRPGTIVNVASILGKRVASNLCAYATAKAGVVQFTRSLALDFGQYGIRSNALCPGYFPSELTGDFLESEAGQRQAARVPMRRFGQLYELDGPLLLLCSEASSYMNGSELVVDGGHLNSTL